MRVDHIGYAVNNIGKAKNEMEDLGFVFGDVVTDDARKVFICFGENDGYRVELVAPVRTGSPIDTQLAKNGPAPYHICYVSDDIESDIARLEKCGFKVLISLAPAVAFGGRQVVFMYSLQTGLVEIVEE